MPRRKINFVVKPSYNERGYRDGLWYWVKFTENDYREEMGGLYTRKWSAIRGAKRAAARLGDYEADRWTIEVVD